MIDLLEHARGYLLAFAAAVALHVAVVAGLQVTLIVTEQQESRFTFEPKPLRAQLVRLNIQRPATPEPTPTVLPNEKDASSGESELVEAIETEEELIERLKREREKRFEEIRKQAFENAVGEELTAEMADAIQDLSQVYITGIYLAVVESWSRPPSARNDMSAVIQVELFPSGDLNSVGVIESSGNLAFDRSALNAVRRASPFNVPTDLDMFESSFRTFRLNFSPKDLLR